MMQRSERPIALACLLVFSTLAGLFAVVYGAVFETSDFVRIGLIAIFVGASSFIAVLSLVAERKWYQ